MKKLSVYCKVITKGNKTYRFYSTKSVTGEYYYVKFTKDSIIASNSFTNKGYYTLETPIDNLSLVTFDNRDDYYYSGTIWVHSKQKDNSDIVINPDFEYAEKKRSQNRAEINSNF